MIVIKAEKTEKGHWSGFEPGTKNGYVVAGYLAKDATEALNVIKTVPFERETEQVDKETGEIRTTKWWGVFYDQSKYVSADIKEITGRKSKPSETKVTYLD